MYPIVKKEKLADKIYLMDVKAPRVAQYCEPGQFVIVKIDEQGERIPLTICDYNREAGTITIVFQTVELVRNGEINIDVQCNPDQGKYVEQIIQDMEAGKEIEKAYYVPERVYTQENVGEEENVTEGISG